MDRGVSPWTSAGYEEAMEQGVKSKLAFAGRSAGMILLYPATIIAGPCSLLLLISSLCVGMDVWSVEGAAHNLSLGLPVLASIAALWVTVVVPPERLAKNRYSFVLAITGLLMVLTLEGLSLRAGLAEHAIGRTQMSFPGAWVFGGPLLVAAVNLVGLIRARNRIGEPEPQRSSPEPVHAISRPHLAIAAGSRPVMLDPYRQPASARSSRATTLAG
jgi:hypothetical protein